VAEIEIALQAAYVARLKGHAALAVLVGAKVFDRAPQGAANWPHVEIGEMQVIEDAATCQDEAAEVFTTLHVYSDAPCRTEARRIAAAIRGALLDWLPDLSARGLECIDHKWTQARDMSEQDGKVTHIVITLRALVENRD
jgi:hypothetical protein